MQHFLPIVALLALGLFASSTVQANPSLDDEVVPLVELEESVAERANTNTSFVLDVETEIQVTLHTYSMSVTQR